MRLATAGRDIRATSAPSSVTRPDCGTSVPESVRRSVVLPDPFGPSTPTRLPRSTPSVTSCSPGPGRAGPAARSLTNAIETLLARSNADPRQHGPSRRGKPEGLLVPAVGEIGGLQDERDRAGHAHGDTRAGRREAGVREQPAVGAVGRLDIEHPAPPADLEEG